MFLFYFFNLQEDAILILNPICKDTFRWILFLASGE